MKQLPPLKILIFSRTYIKKMIRNNEGRQLNIIGVKMKKDTFLAGSDYVVNRNC